MENHQNSRLKKWKNNLLDLSFRNNLLNFRETQKTVPLKPLNLAVLEDSLAEGKSFTLYSKKKFEDGFQNFLSKQTKNQNSEETETEDETQTVVNENEKEEEFLNRELVRQRIYLELSRGEYDKRMKKILHLYRSGMEENGSNTIYLTLGYLHWFESPSSDRVRKAPLILLPVRIKRGTLSNPYQIELEDEEPLINITLLKKLQVDFGINTDKYEQLPEDDSGIDVSEILQRFELLLSEMGKERWKITSESWIGYFSFTKFLMWRDLEAHRESLFASGIVNHLFEGNGNPYPLAASFETQETIDENHQVSEDLSVVDADSSQLAAIYGVLAGNSFVLQGPPGTGKSQTITNMIAQLMAQGKTVLFVSEKMAALKVVYKRLKQVGLGPFCLELHSDKSNKKRIISGLKEVLELSGEYSQTSWLQLTEKLQKKRSRLDSYVELLDSDTPLGKSVYHLLSGIIGLQKQTQINIDFASLEQNQSEEFYLEKIEKLFLSSSGLGIPIEHPFFGCDLLEWSPARARKISDLNEKLLFETRKLRELFPEIMQWLQFNESSPENINLSDLENVEKLAGLLVESPNPPAIVFNKDEWQFIKPQLLNLVAMARCSQKKQQQLAAVFTSQLFELDLENLLHKFQKWKDSFFILAFIFLFFARRKLKKTVKPDEMPDNEEIASELESAVEINQNQLKIEQAGDQAAAIRDLYTDDEGLDFNSLEKLVNWVDSFKQIEVYFYGRNLNDANTSSHWQNLASTHQDLLKPETEKGRVLREFLSTCQIFHKIRKELFSQLNYSTDSRGLSLIDFLAELLNWKENSSDLREWCDYQSQALTCRKQGLAPLVEVFEKGSISRDQLSSVFKFSFYSWWWAKIMQDEPLLKQFRGRKHEEIIKQYQQLDVQARQLARLEIISRLARKIPDKNVPGEMAIIRRQIELKRRHMPLRKLFCNIRTILPLLKPCFLMSPLSVARYLEPEMENFDVVIFDEASQIPPWDAVGALARGNQAVITGDSRQLPPTSFFSVDTSSDDYPLEEEIEDLESILEEAVASGVREHRLRWHYRSRHEALISFSNYRYYENRLHTFPAADNQVPGLGLFFRHIKSGYYDRGKSRTNRGEAEALVAEIEKRLLADESQRSIGVVTFSMAQRQLIEDLLEESRLNNPQIEKYFSDAVEEPVFVKNLENVQGDERAVMFFSVGYGPDKNGQVSMNFGPLNRQGGERRLNVAITRAREELVVFSSLLPEQIDLSRTKSKGVQDFRIFLDYARRGMEALEQGVTNQSRVDFDSPFEKEVFQALESAGLKLDNQVGCSGYRIDLAVVDPEKPGRYILGIECDGATYHSSKCARDRDRIRQSVLESLGWNMYRIWSTDWWYNREKEVEKVVQKYKNLQSKNSGITVHRKKSTKVDNLYRKLDKLKNGIKPQYPAGIKYFELVSLEPEEVSKFNFKVDFYSSSQIPELARLLIQKNSPIHAETLSRQIISFWDYKQLSQKMENYISESRINSSVFNENIHKQGEFYWQYLTQFASWESFRPHHPQKSGDRRELDRICLGELFNCANWILEKSHGIKQEDLFKEVVAVFGFSRLSENMLERLDEVLAQLLTKNQIQFQESWLRKI
ncbi:MAG: DUF4011 domain-containing protein [Deltaproteobacteria bacterium]|jgi:very-short-patch-repair endonuclease|nr:DUF4011 domain-containing protein [Deltaproteobacteria bacterium]